MIYKRVVIVLILSMLVIPSSAFAWDRSTSSVSPDSPYYRDLDKLVAAKLAKPPILGQRPYPRSEFARMTAEAIENLDKIENVEPGSYSTLVKRERGYWQARISIRRLKREFNEELVDAGAVDDEKKRYRIHPLEKLNIYNRYLNSPDLVIISNNGRGSIEANVNPLGDYKLGRHAVDGYTSAEELVGRFQVTKFLSGYVSPRFEVDFYRNDDMQAHAYIQNAYTTFKAGNFSAKVGRDSQVWGFGERGSLLYSTNPRPLDGVWLTNPTPERLPWHFKYLGKWRYTLYGVNLGPGRPRKWSWLMGYKVSVLPSDYVELGFGHSVMIGGEGSQSPSALDVVGEFFGFRPAGTSGTSDNLSNHQFEVDFLVRIVPLRGTQLYANAAIEDKWKSIAKTLDHGMSYLGGIYIPALNPSGSMDLRMEYERINPLQYRHGRYAAGYTENRKIIGSDAGPDSDSVHAKFRHTLSENTWYGLSFDWEWRQSDLYRELVQANGLAGDIEKIASGPTDVRYRGTLDFNFQIRDDVKCRLAAGYERAVNIFYVEGDDRNNYLASVGLQIDLDRFFGFSAN